MVLPANDNAEFLAWISDARERLKGHEDEEIGGSGIISLPVMYDGVPDVKCRHANPSLGWTIQDEFYRRLESCCPSQLEDWRRRFPFDRSNKIWDLVGMLRAAKELVSELIAEGERSEVNERLLAGIDDTDELIAGANTRHSPDFRSVHWFGTTHSFTANQAAVVKVLWENWKKGTADVSDAFLLGAAESNSDRLDLVFRNNVAWGTMIVPGKTKGTRRLAELKR